MSSPWQWLYGTAHRLRRRWWASRRLHLPRPVVSIGNLHWGGSGKTPLTAATAAHLVEAGYRVAILSRGYGRRDQQVRVVSIGEGPLLGPSLAGDEPVLLAGEVPGAAVVVGPERYAAGRVAMQRLDPPPDVFILDDAFSHLALARDVDLLVLPASDPLGGGRLWPSGRLREPLAASVHADAILLSGGTQGDAEAVGKELESVGFAGRAFGCERRFDAPRRITGEEVAEGSRVLLVSGIARPEEFESAVGRLDLDVLGALVFPDHHDYPPDTLREITAAFEESTADFLLTTAKDRVKLLGRLDLPLAELPLRAIPEEMFWRWLDARMAELAPR
ncbi:MAG: tetraacyldisaccharide 4'-kinase [Acidobacteria bacterium]|nr:tetraacyldisaccharide 4'-kinase [Acidobacteriota bacterium]MCZ6726043.1 tetraacyldisaccharide 4'-kinase [Acidobacteriota bacterium]